MTVTTQGLQYTVEWGEWIDPGSRKCSTAGCRDVGVACRRTHIKNETGEEKTRHHVFCAAHRPQNI